MAPAGPDTPDRPDGRESHRLQPLPPAVFGVAAVVGLVLGWLVRPVAEGLGQTAPTVQWLPVAMLAFVAAILGATGWVTWRSVHVRREPVEPHRMVNRLVLARACAIAGALVAGGYAGYALSWLGLAAELASQRILRSSLAAVAGAAILAAGVLLERACRAPDGDDDA